MELWLSGVAIFISAISLVVSIIGFMRTTMYQKYDYTPRIDFVEEKIGMGNYKSEEGFRYFAKIRNRGDKTVYIKSIVIEHGASHDREKRIRYQIKGAFNLFPSEDCSLWFDLMGKDITRNIEKWGIQQYLFWLRLNYKTPEGRIKESVRELGGYSAGIPLFQLGNDETLN